MDYGINNKLQPPEQIYGDAALAMYNLPKLPDNIEFAQNAMQNAAKKFTMLHKKTILWEN
jgi:hypothetical protein